MSGVGRVSGLVRPARASRMLALALASTPAASWAAPESTTVSPDESAHSSLDLPVPAGDTGARSGDAGSAGSVGHAGAVGTAGTRGDAGALPGEASAPETTAAAVTAAAQARVWLEAGKQAFARERFAEAARIFLQAFESDPTLGAALYNRAFALRKAGEHSAARDAYLALLAQNPNDVDAVFGLAETARLLEDHAGAARLFAEYARRETRPARARHAGWARAQAEALAAGLAEAGIAHDPRAREEAEAWLLSADQASRAKRYDEAAEAYARAAALDPTRVDAIYRRALQLRKGNRLAEARDAYRAFLQRVPHDADGVYGFAETLRLMKRNGAAARAFARYVELETRPSEQKYVARARRWVASLGADADADAPPDPDDTLPALPSPIGPSTATEPPPAWLMGGSRVEPRAAPDDTATPGDRASARIWLARGDDALAAARHAEAEREFARAASGLPPTAPEYVTARLGQLRSLYGQSQFVPARAIERELEALLSVSDALREARLAVEPQRGTALAAAAGQSLALARTQALAADWAAAQRNSEHALALLPTSLEAVLLLGRAQLEQGRSDDARATFLHALASHPRSCQASGWLAKIALQEGREADVRRHDRAYLSRPCDDRDAVWAVEAGRRQEEPISHE